MDEYFHTIWVRDVARNLAHIDNPMDGVSHLFLGEKLWILFPYISVIREGYFVEVVVQSLKSADIRVILCCFVQVPDQLELVILADTYKSLLESFEEVVDSTRIDSLGTFSGHKLTEVAKGSVDVIIIHVFYF